MPDTQWRLVFGYQHVTGVPKCPCGDPGNYLSMERGVNDPLAVRFRCWCGATIVAQMDSEQELAEFLAKNGVTAA